MGFNDPRLPISSTSINGNTQSTFFEASLNETRERISKLVKDKAETMNQLKTNEDDDEPMKIIGDQPNAQFYNKVEKYVSEIQN